MDSNGKYLTSNLAYGGTIEGTLNIDPDLNVSDTITCTTLEADNLVVDIQVEDPLIEVGINNPSDNLNLGIFGEYQSSGTKYAGLIRSKDDKKFYLSNDKVSKPLATNTLTNRQGALKMGNLDCLQATIGTVGAQYTLPNTRATIVGQIPVATDLVGGVQWQSSNFNQDLNTTDDVEFKSVETSSLTLNSDKIALGNGSASVSQGTNSVAIGHDSGQTQGNESVALGHNAGTSQGDCAVAVGVNCGDQGTGGSSVAIGELAGRSSNFGAIAIGVQAGSNSQGSNTIALGRGSAFNGSGDFSIAIAPQDTVDVTIPTQGISSISIGKNSSATDNVCVTLGPDTSTGTFTQGSIVIGSGSNIPDCTGFGDGHNNVIIGRAISVPADIKETICLGAGSDPTVSNEMVVGNSVNWIRGYASGIDLGTPTYNFGKLYLNDEIIMNTKKITGVANPTTFSDAVNKQYVDAVIAGLHFKNSCRLKTASALPDYTYANGASGVGATITGNATGLLSVDGVDVTDDDRIFVDTDGTTSDIHNGIYVVTNRGSVGNYILTRATDFDQSPDGEVQLGTYTNIIEGATCAACSFILSDTDAVGSNPIVIGTNTIVFTMYLPPDSTTASNKVGPGVNVFDQKVVHDLQFRKINNTDGKLLLTQNTNNIDIDLIQGNITGLGTVTGGSIAPGFGSIDIAENAIMCGNVTVVKAVNTAKILIESGNTTFGSQTAVCEFKSDAKRSAGARWLNIGVGSDTSDWRLGRPYNGGNDAKALFTLSYHASSADTGRTEYISCDAAQEEMQLNNVSSINTLRPLGGVHCNTTEPSFSGTTSTATGILDTTITFTPDMMVQKSAYRCVISGTMENDEKKDEVVLQVSCQLQGFTFAIHLLSLETMDVGSPFNMTVDIIFPTFQGASVKVKSALSAIFSKANPPDSGDGKSYAFYAEGNDNTTINRTVQISMQYIASPTTPSAGQQCTIKSVVLTKIN